MLISKYVVFSFSFPTLGNYVKLLLVVVITVIVVYIISIITIIIVYFLLSYTRQKEANSCGEKTSGDV